MTGNRHHNSPRKKEILRFLKNQKAASGRFLSFAVASGFANGGCLILQAWLLSDIVNKAVFDRQDLEVLWPGLLGLMAVFVLRAVLHWLSEYFAFSAAALVKKSLRQQLSRKFQEMGPHLLAGEETGGLINTWLDGVDAMHDYYARYFPAMTLMVMVPVAILIFIYPVDLLSAAIMTVTAPLIPLFMILIGMGTEKLNQKQWRKLTYLSGYFLDIIQGMTTLKLFNASRREARVVRQISDDYRVETMKVLRVAFLSSMTLEFFATVGIALVAVTIGFRLMWGMLDFKRGFFVLLLAPEFYLPLRRMGVFYHARLQAIGAAEKMTEIFSKSGAQHKYGGHILSGNTPPHIQFQDVSFAHGDRVILQKASFDILPGRLTGLVGRTGAGKSTIMAMILGFIAPQSGRILVNGLDLQTIDIDSWRETIGWVPQSPQMLKATIRDNILFSGQDVPPNFKTLMHDLRIDEFVDSMPLGYDTYLGERGSGLSGGQIQRLALARALSRDRVTSLLLDEPASGLDSVTENVIGKVLGHYAAGKTCFVIAHRDSTINALQDVYCLENGIVTKEPR